MAQTSITPLKVRLMSRNSNPSGSKAKAKAKSVGRRRNPDIKVALTNAAYTTGAVTVGVLGAKYVDQYMNQFFAEQGVEAQTLGVIKLLGTFGIVAAGEYVKGLPAVAQNPMLSKVIDPLIIGLATFSASSALDLLAGLDILSTGGKDGALAYAIANKPSTGTTAASGSYGMAASRARRRRYARGTMVESPTLDRQLTMGATALMPLHGMRGSLEVYPTVQPSIQQMQGSIMPHGMGATYETRCI